MSNSIRFFVLFLVFSFGLSADTITLSVIPSSETVSLGQMISIGVDIAGLGNPPSVGAFDLTVLYDSALVSFGGVTFGPLLGDTSMEALTSSNASPGVVEFAEVSLLAPAQLDGLQSPGFTLATLSFEGLGSGTASFSLAGGVVDDAFGNKLEAVPEPGTLFLLGSFLVGCGLAGGRKRAGACAVAFAALFGANTGRAQTTTQKTKPNQIAATGRSADPPRPAAPNVCVQHIVTVDAKTGSASLKAVFTNKDKNPKKFAFCQMIGVSDTEMVVTAECDIFKDGNTIKCKRSTRMFSSAMDTFHFGCKQVTLGANEKKTVDYGSGQNDKFKGKKASDFKVTYADYVQLNNGVNFDEASCTANMCFGKNANTGLIGTPEIMGDWYLPKLPFDDPYLSTQPICKVPEPPEYRSLSLPLATPSTFPAQVPQLPHNTPSIVPNSYAVPLNLFDIYTMSPESSRPRSSRPVSSLTSRPILPLSHRPL